ncbi:IS200/IS605 family transposase [Geobacter argillaceus]|uniref:Putative transposase n=1 Tax=Geobacter argillaceus TaxID=345631 RepID=A0A562V706_9BACT|nr:putative transposase [Geobacter argillaceus]
MREWQSLAHVKWECKYHVVIVPRYRKKVLYGRIRSEVGKIIRQLCRQKEVELIEGQACPDHIHLVLSVPPKYSIAMLVGYSTFYCPRVTINKKSRIRRCGFFC